MGSVRPRRFVGRRSARGSGTTLDNTGSALARAPPRRARALLLNQVPEKITKDPELVRSLEQLPKNYDFQVAKTVWRLQKANAKRVALQLPEGLLMFACVLAGTFYFNLLE